MDKIKINSRVKDDEYSPELAENLINEAVQADIVKSLMFSVKFHTELFRQILLMTLLYQKMKELMPRKPFWKKIQPTY